MSIKVGCFALANPFQTLDKQLDQIKEWGFKYADVTDSSDGACLGNEFGFTAMASLDANPMDIKRLFNNRGLTISSVCAHSNLLDASAPWRYGTSQIIKAIRMAATMGVKHVITTEGDPKTEFGQNLSDDEALFIIREKLHEPLRVAEDLGVKILMEPHGHISDSADHLEKLLDSCSSDALALNLDTGNYWLGGENPVDFVRRFEEKIEHVHWKDMPEEFLSQRGEKFGFGMTGIPLGSGEVDIKGTVEALQEIGFDGYTTLEIAGEEAVLESYDYLKSLGAE
ncbi:sugar phosphate isomerase/epimerase family protein [Halalkalibaculum sp. DA3122]|uniref:sugar phosphate isomerase/epimerase family protein n=1 Tax=Halalkalibaculum sp. DA3122 TaxID=3373607 RepID=UPI0037549974